MSKNSRVPYGPKQIAWCEQVPAGAEISSPENDPNEVYVSVPPSDVVGSFPQIDYRKFEIPPTGLNDAERDDALAQFKEFIDTQHASFAGFQGNQDQDYAGRYPYLLDMHANNIGDPFSSGRYTLNSKFCERAVLDYFAALWNNKWPHTEDSEQEDAGQRYWGYVLTMGFTEGNIYGLYNARDYLKGRSLLEKQQSQDKIASITRRGRETRGHHFVTSEPIENDNNNENAYSPVIFYSEDVHYSVEKAATLLELPTFKQLGDKLYPGQCPITQDGDWPDMVPSHDYDQDNPKSGSVRVEELTKLVSFFVSRGYPPIVVANLGTTWKGAYDDVPAINTMFETLGQQYPWLWERKVCYGIGDDGQKLYDIRRGFWLHVDGALGAAYLPFVEMAYNRGLIEYKGPIFDFRNPAVMSVGCSMHKWLGGPWPSGVFLTRTAYQLTPPDAAASFLGTPDTTLGGSRSAFSPMIFWDYFSRMSYEDNMQKALQTEQVAAYLETELFKFEAELKQKFGDDVNLWIARSKLSLTVRFRLVNETLNYKWSLDTNRLWVPISEGKQQQRSYSHIFVMHSVDTDRIDAFIDDLRQTSINDWHEAFPKIDVSAVPEAPNPGPSENY
ncbi:pyridoxal-dependent decarboxylase [Agaribacter flavus]|uniref:Pyridoxal-dependent decarboxylase n=1 Tax=Agaribacter flavus TaxID=1902781 RepID=A0ABV7FQA5_9ALTE